MIRFRGQTAVELLNEYYERTGRNPKVALLHHDTIAEILSECVINRPLFSGWVMCESLQPILREFLNCRIRIVVVPDSVPEMMRGKLKDDFDPAVVKEIQVRNGGKS